MCVKEWFYPESVAGTEKGLPLLVPNDESELAAQVLETRTPHILVQMKRDLAVGACSERVPGALQTTPDCFEPVELPVCDKGYVPGFVDDRLCPSLEVDDAEAAVSETDVPVWSDPMTLSIWPAMREGAHASENSLPLDATVG